MPTTTTAKITCRLVPDQDPEKVQQLIKSHIEKNAPAGVTVDVKLDDSSAKAYKVSPDHPLIQKAAKSYTKAFEKETVFVRMGGSIPRSEERRVGKGSRYLIGRERTKQTTIT